MSRSRRVPSPLWGGIKGGGGRLYNAQVTRPTS
jgi:hypothetical protein